MPAVRALSPPIGLLLSLAWAGAAAAGPEPLVFERVAQGLRGDAVLAFAFDPAGGRIAFADAAGVALGPREGRPERVLRHSAVRDLAFVADPGRAAALLVASDDGLLRLDAAGRVESIAVAPGELARQALRLAVAPGGVALATAGGVYVSGDGRRWERLAGALPSEPATAVALRPTGGGLECWAAVGGVLWRVALRSGPGGVAVAEASRSRAPFGVGAALDLVLGAPGSPVAALHGRELARRGPAGRGWEVLRPALPPGAAPSRLAHAAGRWWLATDRGLLEAPALEGPWRRAPPPLGSAPGPAPGAGAGAVWAGTGRGLWRGRPQGPQAVAPRAVRTPEPGGDPDVRRVQQAALAYLDLHPGRTAELRRGLGRRGWLPELSLELGFDRGESRRIDLDETFSSGAMRRLTDRDRARSDDLAVGVELSWDLGDTAYHPEAIDLSREARAVIALRDDVLDEITQLYFERRRVLLELAALDERDGPEGQRLRLRASELAAGLDAWTGGWFSRHAAPLPP